MSGFKFKSEDYKGKNPLDLNDIITQSDLIRQIMPPEFGQAGENRGQVRVMPKEFESAVQDIETALSEFKGQDDEGLDAFFNNFKDKQQIEKKQP